MGSALVVGFFVAIGATAVSTFINGAYKWAQAYLALSQAKAHIEVDDREKAQKNIYERRDHHSQMWEVGRGGMIKDRAVGEEIEGAKIEVLEGFEKIDTNRDLIASEFIDLVNVGVLSRGKGGKFHLVDASLVEPEYASVIEKSLKVYNWGLDKSYRSEAMRAFAELPVLTEGNFIESVLQQHEEAEEFANRSSAKKDSTVEGEEASEAKEGVNGTQDQPRSVENQGGPGVGGAQVVPARGLGHQPRLGGVPQRSAGKSLAEEERTSAARGKFFRFGSRKGRSS
ncbi:MAG: hypothetical protein JK586_05195 [Nocardiopsis sp. BM-2018]|nr:MAG: hypothetical protein JK586_05195 [Nocardiopsis sp. BM-2018]